MPPDYPLDLLWDLLKLDGPSGDERQTADWLEDWLTRELPDAHVERLGDSLLARRGDRPAVAVFAHLDTTGWTLGYDKRLLPIGGPEGKPGDPIRPAGMPDAGNTLVRRKDGAWKVRGKTQAAPGSRWVYVTPPRLDGDVIAAPYLDNRAGVWAALHVLMRCPNVAVAFTNPSGMEAPGFRINLQPRGGNAALTFRSQDIFVLKVSCCIKPLIRV